MFDGQTHGSLSKEEGRGASDILDQEFDYQRRGKYLELWVMRSCKHDVQR